MQFTKSILSVLNPLEIWPVLTAGRGLRRKTNRNLRLPSVGVAAGQRVFSRFGWPLMLLLAGVAIPAHASVIAVDRADYGATATINGLNGGFGWGSAWTGNNNVVAGSLSRPSVPTAGNRFTTDGNSVGSFRLLATAGQASLLTPGGEFGKDGTTIWVSCLMRRDTDSAAGSGRYAGLSFFHNGGAEELLIGIPFEAANWGIHFHDLGASAPGLSSTPIVNGTAVWLVARITFGVSGTTDRVDLFVNPNPTVAPTTPAVTRTGGNIQFTVIRLQSGNTSTTVSFDELRIGTTWEDVSPATQQDFVLPLGTALYHSAGIFKLERFSQSTAGSASGPNGARFEAYAFSKPVPYAGADGTIGGLFYDIGGVWELTSVNYQTIDPINDFEMRRFYLGSSPFQFPQPPPVEFASRSALDSAWPDRTYMFDLQRGTNDPVLGFITESVGVLFINLATDGYSVPAPVIANFDRLQAWPRTLPLELRWQPFAGARQGDFVQVLIERQYTGFGFTRRITTLAAEPGVIPGTSTNYIDPDPNNVGTAADGAFAKVTFFNITRLNTNDYPGCVGISGVARETVVPIHFVDPIVPNISVFGSNILEGSGSPQATSIEVQLSRPSNTEVSVHYATADDTATAGQDYQATSGTLTFVPGETNKLVQVTILPDANPEPDETFNLVLSSPVIGIIAQSQAQTTILDDDGSINNPPQVNNSIPDTNGVYGTPFSFTFATNTFADPDAGQSLTYSAIGLPSGVTFTPATRTFSGTPTNVGTISVTITATDNGSPALSTNDMFDIIIAKAPLTTTADNQTRAYAETNPPLTFSYAGFVLGETEAVLDTPPIVNTTATNGSPVGFYPITLSGGADDHYTFSYATGTLSVATSPLTVSASNSSRAFGIANPLLTGSLAGIAWSDNIIATFNTTATPNSPPGVYPITPTLQDPDGKLVNYTVATNAGTLTIEGVTLEFTLSSGSPKFCWPTNADAFILEYADNLTPPTTWYPVTTGITTNGAGICFVAAPEAVIPTRFYRLRLP